MGEEETVEVTVKLPKAVAEFLKAIGENMEQYITDNIVGCAFSDLEACGLLAPNLMEKYNLKPVFRKYDELPEYYKDS